MAHDLDGAGWETEGGGAFIDRNGCIDIVTFLGNQITIHPDEWEEMRDAVDQAVAALRKHEAAKSNGDSRSSQDNDETSRFGESQPAETHA